MNENLKTNLLFPAGRGIYPRHYVKTNTWAYPMDTADNLLWDKAADQNTDRICRFISISLRHLGGEMCFLGYKNFTCICLRSSLSEQR